MITTIKEVSYFILFIGVFFGGCGTCVYTTMQDANPPAGATLTPVIEKRETFQVDGKNCGMYYICHYWTIDGKKTERQPSGVDCNQRFVKCEDDNAARIQVNQGKYGWQ